MKKSAPFFLPAALVLGAALLFSLSHPNYFFPDGIPVLAYAALIPVFLLADRLKFWQALIAGLLCNSISYCFYNYWLGTFHPLAQLLVSGMIYSFYGIFLFAGLKIADILFPVRGWLVQILVWLVYEYCKTLWFVGYPYGIMGYTQWRQLPLIQCASVTGVWGVSALVVFPSAFVAGILKNGRPKFIVLLKKRFPYLCGWIAVMAFVCIWGAFSPADYSGAETVAVAVIQPNADPWRNGIRAYEANLDSLIAQSDRALAERPDTALVVWPETAFVPRIKWHYKYRENRDSYNLVVRLLDYLDSSGACFLVGNDDAEAAGTGSSRKRVDYNAALLFRPGENVIPPEPETYRKMHLVPFTEHFPYQKQLPWMYTLLVEADTHFWEKGTDYTVFDCGGLKFSSPVCFEDTFGYLSAGFVRRGARCIVNITNDAWAKSLAAQKQHLSMSVFRAVENRVPLIRSTATGQTAYVLPSGKVAVELEPFAEGYFSADIPLIGTGGTAFSETVYTRYGDWFAVLCCWLLAVAVGLQTVHLFLRKQFYRKH